MEYVLRSQPRPAAVQVRHIDPTKVQLAPPPPPKSDNETSGKAPSTKHTGIVVLESDQYKSTAGVIKLSTPFGTTSSIPYFPNAISKSSKRIIKGDEVEFDLYIIPNTSYARAKSISLLRTKRERSIADQITQFEAAGIMKEQGVIESIKGDYGFIKACDRPDNLFFGLDDLVGDKRPNEVNLVDTYPSFPPHFF